MSPIAYSPKISYDGLVGYWDAANVKSYPGSGTIWRDLSGNGNHGTLSAEGIGTVSGSGVMAFDGTDVITLSQGVLSFGSNDWSAIVWLYPHDLTINWGVLIFDNDGIVFPSNNRIGILQDGDCKIETNVDVSLNEWCCIVGTRTSATYKLYINGVNRQQNKANTTWGLQGVYQIGRGYSSNTFDGLISNVQVYNRALSQSEITQNFQAMRSRYGI